MIIFFRSLVLLLTPLAFVGMDCTTCSSGGPRIIWRSTSLYSNARPYVGAAYQQQIIDDKLITFAGPNTGKDPNSSHIVAKYLSNGEDAWGWDDFKDGAYYDFIDQPWRNYAYDNFFVMGNQGKIIVIDAETGQTNWQKDFFAGQYGKGIYGDPGFGNMLFIQGAKSAETNERKIYRVNLESQELDTIITIPPVNTTPNDGSWGKYASTIEGFIENRSLGGLSNPYINSTGDMMLAIVINVRRDPYDQGINETAYLHVINVTQKRLVHILWLNTLDDPNNPSPAARWGSNFKPPIFFNNRVYCDAGDKIFCFDLAQKKVIWDFKYDGNISFGGFTIAEGKVIINAEGDKNTRAWVWALNAETGQLLWKEWSRGSCSEMLYMDGRVYFTSGGDGLFHAVDIRKGKHDWAICSQDVSNGDRGAFFSRERPVADKQGRVYVRSYTASYCYQVKD